MTNDAGNPVGAYLINPDGVAVGFGQNSVNGTSTGLGVNVSTLSPVPGKWTLIVDFAEPVVGDEISQKFSGNIQMDNVIATAPVPTSASDELVAGTPVTIPVTVTNNGVAAEAVFIDARLDSIAPVKLALLGAPADPRGYPIPIPQTVQPPNWIVPTQTSGL